MEYLWSRKNCDVNGIIGKNVVRFIFIQLNLIKCNKLYSNVIQSNKNELNLIWLYLLL